MADGRVSCRYWLRRKKEDGRLWKKGSAIKIDWIIDWFFRRCTWHTYIIFTWGRSPKGWKGDYYLYLHEIVFRAYVTKGHVTSAGGREPIVILIKRNREFFLFLVMENRSDHPPEDDIHMYSTASEKGKRWQCSKKE